MHSQLPLMQHLACLGNSRESARSRPIRLDCHLSKTKSCGALVLTFHLTRASFCASARLSATQAERSLWALICTALHCTALHARGENPALLPALRASDFPKRGPRDTKRSWEKSQFEAARANGRAAVPGGQFSAAMRGKSSAPPFDKIVEGRAPQPRYR